MTAAGLVVVNPPRTLPEAAAAALPWIAGALQAEGTTASGWLVPPAP